MALAVNVQTVSAALDQWEWLNPLPQGNSLQDVVWDGTRWLAAGEYSTLLSSTNGTDWARLTLTNNFQARGIATSGSTAVVVGWSDYSPQADEIRTAILVSTDGTSWAPAVNGALNDGLIGVVFGGGRWVAVGSYRMLTSPDGVTWSTIARTRTDIISGVSYAGGRFFVLGASGMILTSSNGVDFDDVSPAEASTKTFVSAAYANSRWVVVGAAGVAYRSANAMDWQAGSAGSDYLYEAAAWNNQFLAINGIGRLQTSEDGITWVAAGTQVLGLKALASNGSRIVAVGNSRIAGGTTPEGFGAIHSPMLQNISGVVELNGTLMAWGIRNVTSQRTTGYVAMANAPGTWKSWQMHDTPLFNNVIAAKGILVGAGSSGALHTSPDGINWTGRSTGVYVSFRPMAASPNLIVVGGGNGTILTSPDGAEWTASTLPVTWNIADLAYHDGLFVAALDTGRIYTSPDAMEWTLRFPGEGWSLFQMSWIEGLGFSVTATRPDHNRILLSSLDGIEWKHEVLNWSGTVTLERVHDTAQGLVALNRGSAMLSTDKGATWAQVPVPFGNTLGAAMIGGNLIAYGEFGTLLQLLSEPSPGLSITRTLSGVKISWPDSSGSWQLQSSSSLSGGASWEPVPGSSLENGNHVSEQSVTVEPRYYRLKK